jgi:hypothetical protein
MAKLPTFKKGDRLKHGHVNTLSQGLNEANKVRRGGLHSWGHHVVGTAPWHQRLAIVVDPEDSSNEDEVACDGMAMIRFLYFDPEAPTDEEGVYGAWTTDDSENGTACLDYLAIGSHKPDFGTILTVWWEGMRGAWIPIKPPKVRLCKTTELWEEGTVATLNVWENGDTPNETISTGETLVATNHLWDVASGTWCYVMESGAGDNHLINARPDTVDCATETL